MLGNRGPGLEIGPLHRPVAPKRDGYQVEILDHATSDDLRTKYCNDTNVDVSLIEEVDHVSDGRPMLEVVGRHGSYEWIVASHVIEHAPDMLGFLLDCQALLRPGGRLVLAIPHRRFCFDALRPLTSMGQILQAWTEKRSRHLPGSMYDLISEFSTRGGAAAWGEGHSGRLVRSHSDQAAWKAFQSCTMTGEYVDAHAWVFVPASFRLLIETAHGLGLLHLRESYFHSTIGCEFFIALCEGGRGPGLSLDALRRMSEEEQLAGLLERFNLLPGRPGLGSADAPGGEEVGDLVVKQMRALYAGKAEDQAEIQRLQGQLAESEARRKLQAGTHTNATQALIAADAERKVTDLEGQIAAYRQSTSWRVAAPARFLADLARGRHRRNV
jgi:SAM-dependent methyltransferase